MAMLAGPRRKQKVINLRAKNNTWSNDTNKFGQRMLEKMGWSSGKGLGANENGIVEHVVARYKNDEKGLGFEDKNDQWTKHEDDFNALLANLSNGAEDKEKLHSGVSLEVKSKKSKARVHYHKFTRGKDLTRYSEKDLANIFGKKSFKELKVEDIDKPGQTEDVKTTEQIFTEKGSMEDYFKSKLAAFKSKSKILVNNNVNEDKNAEFAFKGFSNQSDEKEPNDSQQGLGFSFYNTNNNDGLENKPSSNELECNTENNEKKIKKKKKKSKSKDSEIAKEQQTQDVKYVIMENQDVADNNQVPNKKSKKKTSTIDVNAEKEPILDKCKKKRSKRKSIENCQETTEESTQNSQEVTYVPTKKKRRKNKCAKP